MRCSCRRRRGVPGGRRRCPTPLPCPGHRAGYGGGRARGSGGGDRIGAPRPGAAGRPVHRHLLRPAGRRALDAPGGHVPARCPLLRGGPGGCPAPLRPGPAEAGDPLLRVHRGGALRPLVPGAGGPAGAARRDRSVPGAGRPDRTGPAVGVEPGHDTVAASVGAAPVAARGHGHRSRGCVPGVRGHRSPARRPPGHAGHLARQHVRGPARRCGLLLPSHGSARAPHVRQLGLHHRPRGAGGPGPRGARRPGHARAPGAAGVGGGGAERAADDRGRGGQGRLLRSAGSRVPGRHRLPGALTTPRPPPSRSTA